ncbi:hypothetical protein [Rhodoferax sp. GW822-FHT02A01]|uniref:hypothetical protein n=1 Tax=Rhodoferax sp. GW822-FHT02A01 TaxID=3141537 RepID=UPI00315C83A8
MLTRFDFTIRAPIKVLPKYDKWFMILSGRKKPHVSFPDVRHSHMDLTQLKGWVSFWQLTLNLFFVVKANRCMDIAFGKFAYQAYWGRAEIGGFKPMRTVGNSVKKLRIQEAFNALRMLPTLQMPSMCFIVFKRKQ